jgi:hypothetical protein
MKAGDIPSQAYALNCSNHWEGVQCQFDNVSSPIPICCMAREMITVLDDAKVHKTGALTLRCTLKLLHFIYCGVFSPVYPCEVNRVVQ